MTPLAPGGLPDLWLQLCLGEILRQERPRRLVQHFAPPAFAVLDALPESPLAALAFARAARSSVSFAATLYARALVRELSREPPRLPGPPALALAALGPAGASLVFAPVDLQARASIQAAAEVFGVPASSLELLPAAGGGVDGLGDPSAPPADSLVLLAPPAAAQGASAHADAFAAFTSCATQGLRVLLPVPYGPAPADPRQLSRAELLEDRLASLAAQLPPAAFWCGELRSSADSLGCALLAAHLSAQSLATCRELGIRLAHTLSTDPASQAHLGELSYAET